MTQAPDIPATLQNNASYRAGNHDFQDDITTFANSDLVRTILETAMLATDMRFAAVARVTADRWVACRTVDEVNFGLLEGDEIEINSTFCRSVRETSEKVMFNDVATDDVYRNHPIASKFGIVSYASIPIYRSDKSFFGTLCVIDTEPRDVKSPRAVAMLEMFAEILGQGLETEEKLEEQARLVEEERKLARLQEEFVAVLGHDLRNPVAAFRSGLRLLAKEQLSDKGILYAALMESSVHRMQELIDNILMHARTRLGGGLKILPVQDAPLKDAVNQVVEEVRVAAPSHLVVMDWDIDKPVNCDTARMAQALANLLSNAVRHGAEDGHIMVRGSCEEDEIVLSVTNAGKPLPGNLLDARFAPFQRGEGLKVDGLGLGLYIAASIMDAHGGAIKAHSDEGLTTFTLSLPCGVIGR